MTSSSNNVAESGSPTTISRARWLLILAATGSLSIFIITMTLFKQGMRDTEDLVAFGGTVLLMAGVAVLSLFATRTAPSSWRTAGSVPGLVAAALFGLAAHSNSYHERISTNPVLGYAGLVAIGGAMVLAGWIPARRAQRTVVAALLSGEIVDGRLALAFRARGKNSCRLWVDADSLVLASDSTAKGRVFVPTVDVTSVEPWSIAADGSHPVPGEEEMSIPLTSGQAVRIRVPAGDWIFPTDEPATVQRFIEQRIADAQDRSQLH